MLLGLNLIFHKVTIFTRVFLKIFYRRANIIGQKQEHMIHENSDMLFIWVKDYRLKGDP